MNRLTLLAISAVCGATVALMAPDAHAQKVYLNPSDQTHNPVSGGGNEAQYALINANIAKDILNAAGFNARVDQDFSSAPSNANSWGAQIFVSIHTNAGGGHGIETLYKTDGGKNLADKIQNGLLGSLPYQSRGLKYRTDLHVLNSTNMYACLTEALFHDCSTGSGYQGHPPSESAFLRSSDGQQKIGAGIAAGVCTYFGKSCSPSAPTKGFYMGVVYRDPNLDDRIAGATVTLNTGASVVVGDNGMFSFELDPGTYTATATAPGYNPNSSTRDVVAGQDVWGSIGLSPAQPEPEDAGVDAEQPVQDAAPAEDVMTEDAEVPDATIGDAWVDLPDAAEPDEPEPEDGGASNNKKDAGRSQAPASAPAEDDGCGCAVPGASGKGAMLAGVLALLGLGLSRRRKR